MAIRPFRQKETLTRKKKRHLILIISVASWCIMRVKGRNTGSRAHPLCCMPFSCLFSLSPILAFWKWTDNRELSHIIKSNSRKSCDGHTWMKQDKGNLIRRDSILMYYNLSSNFVKGFTEIYSWERSTHHFPCLRRGWVNRDTKSVRIT